MFAVVTFPSLAPVINFKFIVCCSCCLRVPFFFLSAAVRVYCNYLIDGRGCCKWWSLIFFSLANCIVAFF